MNEDLARPTASELLSRSRSGSCTVESIVLACLERIRLRDPALLAWVHVDPDAALERARSLDALEVDRRGPLHGLPIGIKDIILTADAPTQYNSPLYEGFQPRIDAACVSVLRRAGAVILGKTDTVEFGATGRKARTRNPHAPGHTPGGSSSGSAAAVADGHVPLALGTQTGGSMIRPASFCGVWALKPTWGMVGHEGVRPYAPSLDTLGWFARSSADLRLLLDVFDSADVSREAPVPLERMTIASCHPPSWDRAEPSTRRAFDAAVCAFERGGARVVRLDLPPEFDALPALQMRIMRSEARASLLAAWRLFPDTLETSLRDQASNRDGTTRTELVAAYDHAARCRVLFDAAAAPFDAVLAPSTIGSAPAGLSGTGDLVFNGLWSLLHTPCVNVPGWQDERGLPVGLTLTGPRFSDRRVLDVSDALAGLLAA